MSSPSSTVWEGSTEPLQTNTDSVNGPHEPCQNSSLGTGHHCREKQQGKPFLACPKATNNRGKSHRALISPRCRSRAGGQVLQDSLPRKDPLPPNSLAKGKTGV